MAKQISLPRIAHRGTAVLEIGKEVREEMEAKTTRASPSTENREPEIKRVPRWCGVHSSRPEARVWPLLDLLSLLPLRGAARDLRLGSGLTANRINLPYASELYPAFNISSRFSSTSALP